MPRAATQIIVTVMDMKLVFRGYSSEPRADGLFYFFFRLALLGGDPAWQVPHGLPFAIAGVACALDIASEFIATVRKNKATAPMAALTSHDLLIFANRMSPSEIPPSTR
jgi:hypothetical protein